MLNSVGETNAVSAAYENSMPITAADTFTSSMRVLVLSWRRNGNEIKIETIKIAIEGDLNNLNLFVFSFKLTLFVHSCPRINDVDLNRNHMKLNLFGMQCAKTCRCVSIHRSMAMVVRPF